MYIYKYIYTYTYFKVEKYTPYSSSSADRVKKPNINLNR